MNECKKMVSKLGLADNVSLFGKAPRNRIKGILRGSNCFVLPSELETFCVACAEALFCGLPVIATRCGGPESFVDETNGVLIPVNDREALSRAFIWMLNNAAKFDSCVITKVAREKFSPLAVAKQVMKAYCE